MEQQLRRPADTPWLGFDVATDGTRSLVALSGELDHVTAPQLIAVLSCVRHDGHRDITLDLSGLDFLCAAGLTVFARADAALRRVGGRLQLVTPSSLARRVITSGDLDHLLSSVGVDRDTQR